METVRLSFISIQDKGYPFMVKTLYSQVVLKMKVLVFAFSANNDSYFFLIFRLLDENSFLKQENCSMTYWKEPIRNDITVSSWQHKGHLAVHCGSHTDKPQRCNWTGHANITWSYLPMYWIFPVILYMPLSQILQADWSILENNVKATLQLTMPCCHIPVSSGSWEAVTPSTFFYNL